MKIIMVGYGRVGTQVLRLLSTKDHSIVIVDKSEATLEEKTAKDAGVKVAPRPVVIVEGILIFADEALRGRMDLKIFVEADADLRFGRRIERDIRERGRSLTSVMEQYMKTVRPMHERFVEPSRRHADVILKGEGDNRAAVSLIVAHLNACVSHSP